MSLAELHEDLEEHMTGFPAATSDERFVVDTLEKADWAVRKIARERRRLDTVLEVAAAERKRIDEWETEQRARSEQSTLFLLDMLERFHREQLDDDPKAKTIRLPAGELVARKNPDTLICDGGEDTIEWAEANAPDTVVVRKAIDRAKLKRRLGVGPTERPEGFEAIDPGTGEVIPGAWFQIGVVKFTVKTGDST